MDECQVAYQRGFEASRAGKVMLDNPYPTPTGGCETAAEWLAWNEGFVAGEDASYQPTEAEIAWDRLAGGWIGPGA